MDLTIKFPPGKNYSKQGPPPFLGTKKWQSVRRQNGSGSVEICQENASAVNMEPDGSLKLRVED